MIIITSKQEGFRRCGVAHPTTATEYQDGHWSPEDLAILLDEPMLIVAGSGVEDLNDAAAGVKVAEAMTVAQLTERLTALKIEIVPGSKKADLVAQYVTATASTTGG